MKDLSNESVIHVKVGEIEFLQFRRLLEYSDKIEHCFTLRHGGVSDGYRSSLNFRSVGNDIKENVNTNLTRLSDAININRETVIRNYQSHGDSIKIIDKNNYNEYLFDKFSKEGNDGFITKEKDISLLTTAADCNILLFYDPVKNILANIHSGWKGSVKQIYLKAIKMMRDEFFSSYDDIICCISPSIGKCCWRSKDEAVKLKLTTVWPSEKDYIEYKEDGYFYVDFHKVIIDDLVKEGLKLQNIIDANICTSCNNDSFFSFRQSTMKNEDDFATMCMLAKIK